MKNFTHKTILFFMLLFVVSFTSNAQHSLLGTPYQDGIIVQINDDGTALILASQPFAGATYNEASSIVSSFISPSGFDDWFIPNTNQMAEIWNNVPSIIQPDSYYWANNNNNVGPYRWIRDANGGGGSSAMSTGSFNAYETYLFAPVRQIDCIEVSEGTCHTYGCTQPEHSAFNSQATVDDGSCIQPLELAPFGGATIEEYYSYLYMVPYYAEYWAGFANVNNSIYPISFPQGGMLTFNARSPYGEPVRIRFVFEKNPYPDTEPSYHTDDVVVYDGGFNQYQIELPPSPHEYRSVLMYIETRDMPVEIHDISISSNGPVSMGCTDETAINYNASATEDDGSCIAAVLGCTNESAINYSIEANSDDNSCIIQGCTDESALNYNEEATENDGSCVAVVNGCMDELACNYNSEANTDDSSCYSAEDYYDCDGNCLLDIDEDGVCDELEIEGCTDEQAFNYLENATDNDGSCIDVVNGCMDSSMSNYNAEANTDDGSCVSWEELANSLQSELDNVVPEDGVSQEDVDAAYAAGAASVTPEDGVSQADVDAAFTNGVASVEVPECEDVATQNMPLDLPQGWSMFGYTCLEPLDVVEAFSGISDNIEIVKDEWGLAYLPAWDFSAFENLEFGEGYQIKMVEEVTDFQFCTTIAGGASQEELDAAVAAVHAIYEGWCASDIDNDGICDVDEVSGCMDASSCNFVSEAEFDDGSCDYVSCLDECGVLNGDNSTCLDCAGVANGTSEDLGCGCDQPEAQEGYDCEGNEIPTVGDLAHGGIVFYVDETGEHGLVAALEDLTEGATDPNGWGFSGYEWGCYEEIVNGADGQAIGTGYQNTLDIINQECATQNGGITAAQAALDAEINGYSDWYLPSFDELIEMYNTIGNGSPEGDIGGFGNNWFWSSSEHLGNYAWSVYSSYGLTGYNHKYAAYRVRVIRAF